MPAPATAPAADYVVIESTYGDRLHAHVDPQAELADAVRRAFDRNGVVLVPTFAVGRAQLLLLLIARLKAAGHADANELIDWLRHMPSQPRQVFVTHGEPAAADTLRHRIESELHWNAGVPEHRDEFQLVG